MPFTHPPAVREQAITILKQTNSVSAAAKAVGVGRASIIRWYRKAGVSWYRRAVCPNCKHQFNFKVR